MANLDTRSKRASGAQVLRPWGLCLVLPDGTIASADRQHIPWMYSGIAGGSATPLQRIYTIWTETRAYPVEQEARIHPIGQETRVYPVEAG